MKTKNIFIVAAELITQPLGAQLGDHTLALGL